MAIGEYVVANDYSVAIGYGAKNNFDTEYKNGQTVKRTHYYSMGLLKDRVGSPRFNGEWAYDKIRGSHTVAIGDRASTNDTMGIAIGYKASAGKLGTNNAVAPQIAVGALAEASGSSTIAVGEGATAEMDSSIAIGTGAYAKPTGSEDIHSIAFGTYSRSEATESMAFGHHAKALTNRSIAIGAGSEAKASSGVALGYSSVADRARSLDPYLKGEGKVSDTVYGNLDASNLTKASDKSAWATVLGTGTITQNDANLVTGDTVYQYIKNNVKATKVTVDGNENSQDGNLKIKKTDDNGQLTYDLSLNDEITIGKKGTPGEDGAPGKDGVDGKIGINGKDGRSADITIGKGAAGVDGKDGEAGQAGKDGITRIIYKDEKGETRQVATLDDGLKFKGDNDTVVTRKLNTQLAITGGITNESLVTTGNIGVFGTQDGGLAVKLAKNLKGLSSAEFKGDGDKVTNITAQTITQKDGDNITNIKAGDVSVTRKDGDTNKTVNLWELGKTVETNAKATKVTVDGKEESQDGNLKITKTDDNGQLTYDLSLNDEITIGKAGQDGKDGKIGIKGKDGQSADITIATGKDGVDGKAGQAGKDGITRIIYQDENGDTRQVATLDDGLKFKGDNDDVVIRKLNEQLNITGGADAADLSDNNIGVVGTAGDQGGMEVKLSKNLKGLSTAEFKDGDNITNITGGNVTITRKEGNTTTKVDLWELNKTVNNITTGTTDLSSWKLQANGASERVIKKDSIVNFKNGTNTEVTVNGNDITVDLNKATKDKIDKIDGRVTTIENKVNNIDTKIDQKIEDAKITVDGDTDTGVKATAIEDNGKVKGYKVSLDKKVTVGNVAIDGKDDKGEITGLTNTTVDAADFATKGRAATEEQLQAAMGKVQAQSRTTVKGSGNITVTPGTPSAAEYTVELAKDISVNSVTANEYKVGDKTYINQDGINANGKKITNVADGTVSADSTDAVNGKQLYEVSRQIEKSAMGNVQKELSEMGDRVNEVRDESREGDAMNAALAALKPLDFDPYNRSQVMAGVSTYKGKQAVAVGLAHYSNEDTLVHAGISYGGSSDLMANAGISWRFGDKDDRDARAKRAERLPQYAAGPISSVYVMQDEMAALRAENQSLKKENQEIKQQVEMLMKHAGLKA